MKLNHTQAREATFERGITLLISNADGFSFKRGLSTLRGKIVPALLLAFRGAFVFSGHAMVQDYVERQRHRIFLQHARIEIWCRSQSPGSA